MSSFTTLIEKNFPFISSEYQKNSKKPTNNKPSTVQTIHHPLKNTKTVLFETENHAPRLAEIPQTHFLSILNDTFPLWKVYQKFLKTRVQYYLLIILCT